MTDTTTDPIVVPEDTSKSRLARVEPKPEAAVDDLIRADDRLATFWRKYPDGQIDTRVLSVEVDEGESIEMFSGPPIVHTPGSTVYTVRAEVYKHADDAAPSAVAHATRGTDDRNDVTAARAQETAETAAVSRALRFMGILLAKRKKTS